MRMRRGLVVGAVAVACVMFLSGSSCQPPPATPLCGNGRGGQPGSILSADGNHVVFLSDRTDLGADGNSTACDVFVRTLSTGVVERVTSGADVPSEPNAISADGRLVLFPVVGTGQLVEVATGDVLWSGPAGASSLDLTPDGRYLAWSQGVDVHRLDRTTGEVLHGVVPSPVVGASAAITSVSMDDSGSAVAVGGPDGVFSWEPATGIVQHLAGTRTVLVEMSPDGSTVARVTGWDVVPDGDVSLVDRATGEVTLIEGTRTLGSMAWTIDGAWMLFTSPNQTLAGDLTGLDPKDFGAQMVYAYRLRDQRIVRLFRPGFLGWPNGPSINGVFTATERNTVNSPQDHRFQVVALEP